MWTVSALEGSPHCYMAGIGRRYFGTITTRATTHLHPHWMWAIPFLCPLLYVSPGPPGTAFQVSYYMSHVHIQVYVWDSKNKYQKDLMVYVSICVCIYIYVLFR